MPPITWEKRDLHCVSRKASLEVRFKKIEAISLGTNSKERRRGRVLLRTTKIVALVSGDRGN